MGALPKRKTSKARKGERRSHLQLKTLPLSPCPHCRTLRPTHRVCPNCGTYAGREIVRVKGPAAD
ncbi:MAG: 50S ribosomal protein L32 [Chloroflexi bacterium]|nr:50S ribosomal protein L32 [Chloroflexota bacterium]